MSNPRHIPRLVAVLGSTILLASVAGGSVLASDDPEFDRSVDKLQQQLKLKKASFVTWSDGLKGLIDTATGQPIAELDEDAAAALGAVDVLNVGYATVRLTKPMIKAIERRTTARSTSPVIGNDAQLKPGQHVLVLVTRTAAPFGGAAGGAQAHLGFSGPDGVPLYPGGQLDLLAGNETLVTFGRWPDVDPLLTATTQLDGVLVGGAPDWNSGDALGYGYADGDMSVFIYPLPVGAASFDLRMLGGDGSRQVMDVFTTADGGTEFPLVDLLASDACVSGVAFAEQDADGDLAGFNIDLGISPVESVENLTLPPIVLVDQSDGQRFGGLLETFPEVGGAFINFSTPPGNYTLIFEPDGSLTGPSAERLKLLDSVTLDLTRPVSGPFFGSQPCGLLPGLDGGIPEAVLRDFAEAVGADVADAVFTGLSLQDGTDVGALLEPSGAPLVVFTAGSRPATRDLFDVRVSASPWESESFDFGDAAIVETTDTGIERLFFLQGAPSDEGPSSFGRMFSAEVHPGAIDPAATDADGSPIDEDLHPIFNDVAVRQAISRAAAPYLQLEDLAGSEPAP